MSYIRYEAREDPEKGRWAVVKIVVDADGIERDVRVVFGAPKEQCDASTAHRLAERLNRRGRR